VATIDKVLTGDQLKKATILNCYTVTSGWWENEKGHFTFHAFPSQAQVSPVQSIIVHDFNQDEVPDIILAGNKYGMEVETGRLDSGTGVFLQGNSIKKFSWVNNMTTGFWAPGDVRDMALLYGTNKQVQIIVSNNNGKAQIYQLIQSAGLNNPM